MSEYSDMMRERRDALRAAADAIEESNAAERRRLANRSIFELIEDGDLGDAIKALADKLGVNIYEQV